MCCIWSQLHTSVAHAGQLFNTLFGSEGQGQDLQQGAPPEISPHEALQGSQQHAPAPASAETEATAEQPASGADREPSAALFSASPGPPLSPLNCIPCHTLSYLYSLPHHIPSPLQPLQHQVVFVVQMHPSNLLTFRR